MQLILHDPALVRHISQARRNFRIDVARAFRNITTIIQRPQWTLQCEAEAIQDYTGVSRPVADVIARFYVHRPLDND